MSDDGGIELRKLILADRSGQPLQNFICGQDCAFEFEFSASRSYSHLTLIISINDELGIRIAQFNTAVRGFPLRLEPGVNRLTCLVPHWPLSPRTYTIEVLLQLPDNQWLHAPSAAALVVENGDYFQSGRMWDSRYAGQVQVMHDWQYNVPLSSER